MHLYYYNFHSDKDLQQFWHIAIDEDDVTPRNLIGLISYTESIFPFDKTVWEGLHEVRNEIIHRNKTEATLGDVLNGLACLIVIAARIFNWNALLFEFQSILKILVPGYILISELCDPSRHRYYPMHF